MTRKSGKPKELSGHELHEVLGKDPSTRPQSVPGTPGGLPSEPDPCRKEDPSKEEPRE